MNSPPTAHLSTGDCLPWFTTIPFHHQCHPWQSVILALEYCSTLSIHQYQRPHMFVFINESKNPEKILLILLLNITFGRDVELSKIGNEFYLNPSCRVPQIRNYASVHSALRVPITQDNIVIFLCLISIIIFRKIRLKVSFEYYKIRDV